MIQLYVRTSSLRGWKTLDPSLLVLELPTLVLHGIGGLFVHLDVLSLESGSFDRVYKGGDRVVGRISSGTG